MEKLINDKKWIADRVEILPADALSGSGPVPAIVGVVLYHKKVEDEIVKLPNDITFISDSDLKPFPGLLTVQIQNVRGHENWYEFNGKTYERPNKSLIKDAVESLVKGSITDIQETDFKRFSLCEKTNETCSTFRVRASAQDRENQLFWIMAVKDHIKENIEKWGIARVDVQITNLLNKKQWIFDIQLFHKEVGVEKTRSRG